MRKQFTAFAKRALAFTLVLVLLLALIPAVSLTVKAAAYDTTGWEYASNYTWLQGRFHTNETDLTYEDNDPYDWEVTIYQGRTDANLTVTATVKDASGKTVASVSNKPATSYKGQDSTMLSASDLSLSTSLYGKFTLVCQVKYNGSTAATLTKTFSRVSSNPFTSTVTSRSNPDNVFTFADPIDLVLNIKKNDGVAAAYNAAVTVTKGSTELLAARGVSLPAFTNTVLSVKDLVNLPSIETAGTYKVNLTLTDTTGAIKHQASFPFYVVALTGNVTATITSATSTDLTFNAVVPDLVVNLKRTDGVAETLTTAITVTDSTDSVKYSKTFETTTATATVTPDLSGLATTGTFTLTAVVTDDAGNQRATTSATFTRTNTTPMSCTITDYCPNVYGEIYSADNDFYLSLKITHMASKGQVMTVKATGTLNGKAFEASKKATLSSLTGTATVKIDGAMLNSYGIFEDLSVEVYNASGTLLWESPSTYSFSRVLSTANPGQMPLLNINDHFTTGKGDANGKIPLSAQTGANMWRGSIPWASTEKSKGVYTMPEGVQEVMDITEAQGMQALILLAYNNDLYGEVNPTSSTWLNAYANYCYYIAKMMAQYYPDQVVGFEIWNEWNHATMSKVDNKTYRTGDHYATVVKAASAKIRQVNREYGTNFKVIAGSTAGDGYGDTASNTFINAMFGTTGFFEAVDGVSFHTYSSMETTTITDRIQGIRRFEYVSPADHDFAARISNYKTLLSTYNAPSDLEVWLTETGWTTNEVPEDTTETSDGKRHITTGATEQEAAAYLVQLYAWALYDGTLDRIFWYDLMNDISNQTKVWANNQTESNYGLIHNWDNSGNQPLAYSAKQGYVTMCALSSKLAGATNGKTINLGNGIYAYQFAKGGNYIMVAWTNGTTKNINLTLAKSITATDMYGNAIGTYSGSAALTITENPIYIEYPSNAITSIG